MPFALGSNGSDVTLVLPKLGQIRFRGAIVITHLAFRETYSNPRAEQAWTMRPGNQWSAHDGWVGCVGGEV
ncbi:hypothetical protein E2562_035703 [Oryza meyeriana var. granulata]|uniref:Uncharacterized protein n=1 Tax=Oryza meyeriana var. granulata TaxID=110450 RepID=A0A6G1C0M3_9ORYZ|nr:hypothetical protein E2562_035703 [Oryza meyeriana var. granulata]